MSPQTTTQWAQVESLDPHKDDFAVEVVDQILRIALQAGASDVHLQPREVGWEILVRVDGVLTSVAKVPGGGPNNPVTRLMVLAGLPTYRSGQPMEGRLQSDGDALPMRLGIFPTVHGPRGVIRLLGTGDTFENLESLGLPEDVERTLVETSQQTDGAVLLSGPAGSGKTTTLYALLRRIASSTPRRSVMTIEDPVESVIDCISQSELDSSSGLTLAAALRSAVRQDSEVLLVSEIRDPETAEAAMQASLTGHLIYSSLHASDVAASLRRLMQFGVPMHAMRSGVRAIVSVRLLRRKCEPCEGDLADCDRCMGLGYRGRLPVAQAVRLDGSDPVGESLMNSLEQGASLTQMRDQALAAGGIDLLGCAQAYVDAGLTDPAEVYRVLGQKCR